MRRKTEGLEPHDENKIVLSKIDKIIFAIGISVYAAAVFAEEKLGRRTAVSSSFAITVVGIFLISRAVQKRKFGELIFTKEKLLFLLTAIGGVLLSLYGVYSLIKDIIAL